MTYHMDEILRRAALPIVITLLHNIIPELLGFVECWEFGKYHLLLCILYVGFRWNQKSMKIRQHVAYLQLIMLDLPKSKSISCFMIVSFLSNEAKSLNVHCAAEPQKQVPHLSSL